MSPKKNSIASCAMIWEQTKWKTGLGRQRKLQIKLQDYEDANYCAQPKNYERRKKWEVA